MNEIRYRPNIHSVPSGTPAFHKTYLIYVIFGHFRHPGVLTDPPKWCYALPMKPTRANIRKIMHSVTPEEYNEGMSWYVEAYGIAKELTPGDPSVGGGILAALSPMTSWPQNIVRARTLVSTGTVKALPDSVSKAIRILNGEPALDVLRGPKVVSFYHDIMGLENESVTVDRHAVDIACGKALTDSQRAPFQKGKNYAMLAKMYKDVAREFGVSPAQLQAITWVHWRKNHAVAFHG